MAGSQHNSSSPCIFDIPAKIMDEFCRCMDCLSDWEWMSFASSVIDDQTVLRRIRSFERTGVSVTRELMWSWGQKLPSLQELVDRLQKLELYRALGILQQWAPVSVISSKTPERRKAELPTKQLDYKKVNKLPEHPSSSPSELPAPPLPSPPPPPSELLQSLSIQSECSLEPNSPKEILNIPQQEESSFIKGPCKIWTQKDLDDATDSFCSSKIVHEGEFADIFMGYKEGKHYTIKRLKMVEGEEQKRMSSFFHTEAQISFRCCHANILPLLGFCMEGDCSCLVNQFMMNGSLDLALQQSENHILNWKRRLKIALGFLKAVQHLHSNDILHGNIKSSNILLDENLLPKLAHSGLRYCPDKHTVYTKAKSKDLQIHQPYLPYSFFRHGQLTVQTDIFACGVVLAEILTGQKASDRSRNPVYLKDLFLEEMERAKEYFDLDGKQADHKSPESLCSHQISSKYMDSRTGLLPNNAAFHFSFAACLCLIKKKPLLAEIYTLVEKAERCSRDCQNLSLNVPEESDFDESLSFEPTDGAMFKPPSSSSQGSWSMENQNQSNHYPKTTNGDVNRTVDKNSHAHPRSFSNS
ncbi:interleukin-1 receptor-associated kinase-like 2 isoform X1 [Xenopus laevis]|uniref:Interleukin-1 receptor-associated kinase-like 2 n=1 Tax=Xenopus laevis TaxID=8355 RepID=A0A8J0V7Y9_XENLA|nr:interleukin-1 receptor-associated kinase-like 2 isoform X1 [Xenopus laevis]